MRQLTPQQQQVNEERRLAAYQQHTRGLRDALDTVQIKLRNARRAKSIGDAQFGQLVPVLEAEEKRLLHEIERHEARTRARFSLDGAEHSKRGRGK